MFESIEGIALADTFELLEQQQGELFTRENTERVKRQKAADMFVVIGNPPYNAWQVNDRDNNRNRMDNGVKHIETPGMPMDWRLKQMRLSKDKTQLTYNDFLTLDGIPAEVYDYRLGTRSAVEWVVDQYRVKIDKRGGIVNDPNRADQPRYIVDLIARVITVSLKTVEIVSGLPSL